MKSLQFYARRDIRLEDIPKPEPSDNQVQIRVTDAGLSQTQVNEFIEGPFIISNVPHPKTGIGVPIIPCQEYGGEVVQVGAGVDPSWLGKTVAVLPLTYCGKCDFCLAGQVNQCSELTYHGLVGDHGGFCEFSVVDESNLLEVDPNKPELLTFVEPLLVGVHAYHRYGQPLDNKKVLILGAGAIGMACAAVWQTLSRCEITLCDYLPKRLDAAKALGFSAIANSDVTPWGFDVVVDAAGKDIYHDSQAFEQAPSFVRPGGCVMSLGTYFFPMQVTPIETLATEVSHIPSFMYNQQDVEVLKSILPDINIELDRLITRVAFENLIQDGYYQAELDRDAFIRIVTSANG
ncbi:alcohol dehydrogenase catalytic domain-containing protein [Vibrio sp. SCSIO 43136]|uniref:alcohol dehydrogenase catalytic domain-containing protein n=1 Tax=Vibrio sp. SCSIO 43136 TaxID=2819101 RepID=UPI002074EE68|nr:alcohol dehydrogenase catalytic domain-containing protein [Vibrio sp. SCSIO 43136]USD66468.1 alcohol dehydrogenase catalytic domain-containing protein [Vibrio sp. SCSIO 43136]